MSNTYSATNIPANDKNAILIQGAMDCEISVLLSRMEGVQKTELMQFPFYMGRLCGQKVIVSKTFQGMVNASAATVLAISHFMPRCIINQGVCGGHDPALHRGDIILGETIFNYSNLRFSDSPDENPLHGCMQIGCESLRIEDAGEKCTFYHSDKDLLTGAQKLSATHQIPALSGLSIKTGTIASCDAWLNRLDYIHFMHTTFHTCGEDMETAAVAQLCHSYAVPLLSLRSLSNTLVHQEDYEESAAANCQHFVCALLPLL